MNENVSEGTNGPPFAYRYAQRLIVSVLLGTDASKLDCDLGALCVLKHRCHILHHLDKNLRFPEACSGALDLALSLTAWKTENNGDQIAAPLT